MPWTWASNRDVSNEIMFEGSPDASRFLGLDRKSFVATAVVESSMMLTILSMLPIRAARTPATCSGDRRYGRHSSSGPGRAGRVQSRARGTRQGQLEQAAACGQEPAKPCREPQRGHAKTVTTTLRLVRDAEAHHAKAPRSSICHCRPRGEAQWA